MAATSMPFPRSAPLGRPLGPHQQTCQVIFVGEGPAASASSSRPRPVSPSRRPTRTGPRVFRYDPALENNGWHNSTRFPVDADNPLNGNMYRPLYFDNGQAIHGAANVPAEPASKGCVRLRLEDQDALLAWLGLDGLDGPTYDSGRIGLSVSVQGEYVPG